MFPSHDVHLAAMAFCSMHHHSVCSLGSDKASLKVQNDAEADWVLPSLHERRRWRRESVVVCGQGCSGDAAFCQLAIKNSQFHLNTYRISGAAIWRSKR